MAAEDSLSGPACRPKLYTPQTSDRVQGRMLRAMVKGAPKDAEVEALIEKEVAGKSALVQLHATIAMAFVPSLPKILELLRKLSGPDSASNLRGLAVWALGMQRDAGSTELLTRIARPTRSRRSGRRRP